jgi:steroid 5-alpha reductase family enzyme
MPDHPLILWFALWGGAALVMVALWVIQRARSDASLVDAGWAGCIGLCGASLLAAGHGDGTRRLVAGLLIGAWSLRLTIHLLRDRVIGKHEDGRYQMLRAQWGVRAQPKFFVFFQLQALLAAAFSLPFLTLAGNAAPFGQPGDLIALCIWALAVAGEMSADRQLAVFRADPVNRGRTCRSGWWRYSRHPNYFFEWLHWWTYVGLCVGEPTIWIAVAVPVVLLVLLLRVTGIPYTEARALASRGDDYRAYQQTTSAFVPWFPRRPPPALPKEPS